MIHAHDTTLPLQNIHNTRFDDSGCDRYLVLWSGYFDPKNLRVIRILGLLDLNFSGLCLGFSEFGLDFSG